MLSPEQGKLGSDNVPATYHEALRGLQAREYIAGDKFLLMQDRANRKGAQFDIRDFERAFVRRMRKLHVPVYAHSMVRTPEEQDALFVRGVSKAKGHESAHVSGCAVDIVHAVHHWKIPDKSWALFGHVGKEVAHSLGIKITWGGDWKFWDPAHWELTGWRELPHVGL